MCEIAANSVRQSSFSPPGQAQVSLMIIIKIKHRSYSRNSLKGAIQGTLRGLSRGMLEVQTMAQLGVEGTFSGYRV